MPNPTYDLSSLPWQLAKPRTFDLQSGRATLVTNDEPFAYQAFATINRNGADSALIQYDIDVESGGTSVGLLQSGKWIAISSSTRPGNFAGAKSALLGYNRSLTVVIANNNPAGESRLNVKSLRLYLRQ